MLVKITSWVVYGLIFSLLPILLTAVLLSFFIKGPSLNELVGHGELFIITVTLIAPAIEGSFSNKTESVFGVFLTMVSRSVLLFFLILSTFSYAGLVIANRFHLAYKTDVVIWYSISLFVSSVLVILGILIYKGKMNDED